ncbi:MAG: ATP-dependent DNA helicase RecG [Gammaproteobacteria bacterium]
MLTDALSQNQPDARSSPSSSRTVKTFRGTLARLGIGGIEDLLFELPLRYEDETRLVPIGALVGGQTGMIQATIELTDVRYAPRRQLVCRVSDGTGFLNLRFFHFQSSQREALQRGNLIRAFGTRREGQLGPEFIHPRYQVFRTEPLPPLRDRLTPVYTKRKGMGSRRFARLVETALAFLRKGELELIDRIPRELTDNWTQSTLLDALENIHQPPPEASTEQLSEWLTPFRQRLALEELLAHALSLRKIRSEWIAARSYPLTIELSELDHFIASLPWPLTSAQFRVWQEIARDLERPIPMLRLLQGDVGSGKTVLAALTAFVTVRNQGQAAVMAPTELLVNQHARTFHEWLSPHGVPVRSLHARLTRKGRREVLQELASGLPCVVLGTQSLFQGDVEFPKLMSIIIDEQHRFGVEQRLHLSDKGPQRPHQLIMTATPIPRTLAMSLYAGLDQSRIDELPPGRIPVTTVALPEIRRAELVTRLRSLCQSGQQVFWVCPRVEDTEGSNGRAVETAFGELRAACPDLRLGMIHGRMESTDRQRIIEDFQCSRLDILVATTIIEVGVDIPRANVMVIDGAERLGLLQLHQLRGRIGRGTQGGQCLLIYGPLSPEARARLDILRKTTDGFVIAERDLEIRGPGEVWGTRQSGGLAFRIADLFRDRELLARIPNAVQLLEVAYPESVEPLIHRWLGANLRYGQA